MTRTTVTSTLHVTISTRPRSRVRRWIGMHLALLGLYIHHGGLHLALPKIVMDETLEVDEGEEPEGPDLRTFEDLQPGRSSEGDRFVGKTAEEIAEMTRREGL